MSDVGPSQEGENYEEDIFKVSPSYGGNPLPIPEEGEIGWGSTPTFEPWEDTGWEADASQRLRISNNYKTATAMLEMTCVAVMGERTFSTGLHAWTVIIEVCTRPPPPLPPLLLDLHLLHLRQVYLLHHLHRLRLVDHPAPHPARSLSPSRRTSAAPPHRQPTPLPLARPPQPPQTTLTPTLSPFPYPGVQAELRRRDLHRRDRRRPQPGAAGHNPNP